MRQPYVEAKWDDPFETRDERRSVDRFEFPMEISITAPDSNHRTNLVGPGVTKNISMGGAFLYTKHDVQTNQRVRVRMDLDNVPLALCLPTQFEGDAEVIHVRTIDGRLRGVALRFSDSFTQSMEFALYVDYLRNLAAASSVAH